MDSIKKVFFLGMLMMLFSLPLFSQQSGDPAYYSTLKKLSEKYNGKQIVELDNGIVLKADGTDDQYGCLFIAFKGHYPVEDVKNFEDLIVIPLTEIKSINGEPVDKFYANVSLCDFYLSKQIDIAKAEVFLKNAQGLLLKNSYPEKYKGVVKDLQDKLDALKQKK